eukprot:350264-Chlamydomonas_euryale.AAC.3
MILRYLAWAHQLRGLPSMDGMMHQSPPLPGDMSLQPEDMSVQPQVAPSQPAPRPAEQPYGSVLRGGFPFRSRVGAVASVP